MEIRDEYGDTDHYGDGNNDGDNGEDHEEMMMMMRN